MNGTRVYYTCKAVKCSQPLIRLSFGRTKDNLNTTAFCTGRKRQMKVKRIIAVLLAVIIAIAAVPVQVRAEEVYTVTLDPGKGTGEPITYSSADQDSFPDWRSAGNLQFYRENDGRMGFKLDSNYCPDSFSAPEGYEFDSWDLSGVFPLSSQATTCTVRWTQEVSLSLTPKALNLSTDDFDENGWMPFTVNITKLDFGPDADYFRFVKLQFYSGEVSMDEFNCIGYSLYSADHNEGGGRIAEDFLSTGSWDLALKVDPQALAAATPGVYKGSLNYTIDWKGIRGIPILNDDSIPLTLTVTDEDVYIEPDPTDPEDTIPGDTVDPKAIEMHRLYNPNSGEHFYTGNLSEKDSLINEGWNYEGVAWNAPDFSLNPVYRLYDKNAGVHRYTMDEDKRDGFIAEGWSDEGIGWYSDEIETIPVFGLYNKNALQAGAYHFTADESERDSLIELGWTDEGIGWYGVTSAESEYVPGDTVILGSYEQDNDLSNGPEPIEWQVIGTRDGHTLLLSKYALESNKYNETYMEIDWENCTLRSWLNNDFYNTAFSASDRKRIVTAHNENPDSYELYKPWNKDSEVAGAVGGNATDDNVFLLSFEEVRDYLDGRLYNYKIGAENYNQKLLCRPTAYVKAQGVETYSNSDNIYPADTVGCCWWWLRSPGYAQDFAASVCDNGALSNRIVKYDADGVRPALLID